MRFKFFTCAVGSMLVLSGCSAEQIGDVDSINLSEDVTNGIATNGIATNGIATNGWEMNGELINSGRLDGSLLSYTKSNGKIVGGQDLVGIKMPLGNDGDSSIKVRIDAVTQNAATGVYEYVVSAKFKTAWQPLCGIDPATGSPITAIPIAGRYDSVTGNYAASNGDFTFACTTGALGKCILWGYQPWAARQECLSNRNCKSQSVQPWHQACVHMVRADYCGDGVSHTRNGTEIDIWDILGIQSQGDTNWTMEAEWTASGAQCIRHTRWLQADGSQSTTDLEYIQSHCPERLAANQDSACDPDRSNFLTRYGYNVDPMQRRLLRNESDRNR